MSLNGNDATQKVFFPLAHPLLFPIIKYFKKEVTKMKKVVIVLALVAVGIFGVTYVYAVGPGFGPGFGRGDCPGFQGTSSLTPEQKSQLDESRKKFFDETVTLRETMRSKRLELRTLWADPKADPAIIQAKERELRELSNQMRDKMVQHRLEARNLLTDEQLAEFGSCGGRGRGFGRGMGRMGRGGF
jgi:Spy/CpxP family protein refolding chaperone